jgi:hypothetical protein
MKQSQIYIILRDKFINCYSKVTSMDYEVNIVWYHQLGTDRTYRVKENANIRPSLMNFLETLHMRRDSIIAFDKETIERTFEENPELQIRYEKRRQQLLTNPREGSFNHFFYHKQVNREALDAEVEKRFRKNVVSMDGSNFDRRFDVEFNIILEESHKYRNGAKKSDLINFPELDRTVLEELEKYTSLLSLIKYTSISYSENLGIFFPRINDIDQNELNHINWHAIIGSASMDLKKEMQYISLEECLNPKWDMKPTEISLPVVADGEITQPGNRCYMALGHPPGRPKHPHIINDLGISRKDTIDYSLSRLKIKAWNNFLKKNNWPDMSW